VLGIVTLALILTFSRASALAFAAGIGVIAVLRYRRFIPLLIAGGLLLLLLPQTQAYIDRFTQGFAGQDLATQMRIGEYTDALRLIGRYPVFGVGFTGTPDNDIYTNAASLYLIMANQIGLAGVALFLTTIGAVFVYGATKYRRAAQNAELDSIHLGYHVALFTALVNGAADLYFFRIDFQASILLFWSTVALALASSHLLESTVD
jgi:O-antigen ligase